MSVTECGSVAQRQNNRWWILDILGDRWTNVWVVKLLDELINKPRLPETHLFMHKEARPWATKIH